MSFDDAFFRPPVTVFLVWGCFVICFLVCGSSRKICNLLCCGNCVEDPRDYEEEILYEHLSSRRKEELDNLRSIAILRQLSRFTLTLKSENLKRCLPDSETQSNWQDNEKSGDELGNCNAGGQNDIEMANSTNDKNTVHQEHVATDDVEFTHVLIPHPGYDSNGTLVKEEAEGCNNSDKEKKSMFAMNKLPFCKSNKNDEISEERKDHESNIIEGNEECKEEECTTDDIENGVKKQEVLAENREAPIFCAVCLMEYEVKDRLCWASNRECTHVFHEDCILQWLVSLGKKRSKRQTFTRNPTEQRLLDFDMQCPCCRQDFVSKNLTFTPAPGGEEDNEREDY